MCHPVLHGRNAVASLKDFTTGYRRLRVNGSPRQKCRGLIEGSAHAEVPESSVHVLHGRNAVASLKEVYDKMMGAPRIPFSTAEMPWPH